MNFVLDQVVQLHHVHHADRHGLLEGQPVAAVKQRALPGVGQIGPLEHLEDFLLSRAVKDWRGEMNPGDALGRQLERIGLGERLDELLVLLARMDLE